VLQHPQFTLSILDPNSLLGGETVEALRHAFPAARRRLFHTTGGDDHLVTEIAGEAALVPPLASCDELDGTDVLIATTPPSPAVTTALLGWLRANPGAVLVDGTQPGIAPEDAVPVFTSPPPGRPERRWFHLADPAFWGPGRFLQALAPFGPRELHLTTLMPVASFGDAGIEELAKQAAGRLSGRPPLRAEVLPAVLAFDVAPASAARSAVLAAQLRTLFPALQSRLRAIDAGIFHGHAADIEVRCEEPLNLASVVAVVRAQPGIRLARRSERPQPTGIIGSDDVLCADLQCTGCSVTAWLVADGLRVGGAQAIADLVATVRAS
jgi:hypothetical protein